MRLFFVEGIQEKVILKEKQKERLAVYCSSFYVVSFPGNWVQAHKLSPNLGIQRSREAGRERDGGRRRVYMKKNALIYHFT